MTNCSHLICLIVGLALSHPAFARLGESEAECDARYGVPKATPVDQTAPILEGGKTKTYRYQGWTIRVAFVDGIAVRENYQRIPTTGVSPRIKDFELAAILEGEMRNGFWSPQKPKTLQKALEKAMENTKDWVRSDGATASLIGTGVLVRLELPAASQAEAQAKDKRLQDQKAVVPKF